MDDEKKFDVPSLPMLELFKQYFNEVEKVKTCNGSIIAAAILTGFDVVLRYADFMIKAANAPVEPKEDK